MPTTRKILGSLLGSAALVAVAGAALADYPERQINFIVPHAAGSTADVGARIIADGLQARLGQPVVVENRAGAGGSVGTQSALLAEPDGYTLILIAVSNSINEALRDDLEFDMREDVVPVTLGWTAPNVAVVNPNVPAETLEDYIEYAKSRPGELDYASSGIGTSQHFGGEMLKLLTGIEIEHIPYSVGAQSVSDALGGAEILVFNSAPMLKEHIDSGALRALGVTTGARSPVLPDVPTFQEAGVEGYDIGAWWGLAFRAGTPDEIVDRINEETVAVLEDPAVVERFANLGANAAPMSRAEFETFLNEDLDKFQTIVAEAGITID
jgi:tripartite-type tricarboxylate transporter receptor subunit TctC